MVIEEVVGLLVLLAIVFLVIKGGIQTFQRNWILAILLLIFLSPIWVGWALVEVFLPKPVKQPIMVQMQPVDVNINNNKG